jgi:prephenate dehydrogenase
MAVNIVILGLGRVGASLGLKLMPHEEVSVSGFDPDAEAAKQAQGQGVVRRAHWNLLSAVDGADLVLLALPLDAQRDTLKAIGPELREGAVVASVAPLLRPPLEWAASGLPADDQRHFVACHAVLSPARLHGDEAGLAAAAADLFEGGLWAMAPAPGCAPEALKLVADLARLLGAAPYFADPLEHDGLVAAADGLPALLALALMRAATASPGWTETRKVADRSFATATAALVDAEPGALRHNRDNLVRYLDAAMAELGRLRGLLEADNLAALSEAFTDASERREVWLAARRRGDWERSDRPVDVPTTGDLVGRMFLGRMLRKKDKGE